MLLIDVENVIGANAQPATATLRMNALLRHTGPLDQTIAASARDRIRSVVASGLQHPVYTCCWSMPARTLPTACCSIRRMPLRPPAPGA
ncbi:hypothetical protein [Streptomyces sp. NPDC018045]|uniref:hypothetical protein n=1 Tax=Streptomyces sp. NPDC018045 TaxID=3365037 RepID=UPI0037B410F4